MSEDPRVARTKRRLKTALLEMIDEVGYEQITIERLAERADVARSTFYTHYGAKEDLLFDGFEAWLRSFAGAPCPHRDGGFCFRFSLPLLRHGAAQKAFFRNTILRGPSHRVRRRLKEVLAAVAWGEMASRDVVDPEAAPAEGRAFAVAGAFLGLLEWWFDEGRALAPEEVDRVFQEAVARG
ncbi:MAG: TetR/AcrR family transcriptional regulator [Gemmatimonadota bacterium]|nr:TetR/AcrR family transcriptional regulator [Gemmatimonadota bacterium]